MHRIAFFAVVFVVVSWPAADAREGYYDYARVIDAEPITVTKRVAVSKKVCPQPSEVSPPGDARRDRPDASIGELIRADTRQRRPVCRTVTGYEQQESTVGWRVSYRYAGRDYVRRMTEKPGERIKVRINLDAG